MPNESMYQGTPKLKEFNSTRIGIFVAADASFTSMLNIFETFRAANRVTGEELFEQYVLTIDGEPARTSAGMLVPSDGKISDPLQLDVVVVVASYEPNPKDKAIIIGTLQKYARHGAMTWGIDSGVLWLIEAGLVRSNRITAHWEHISMIREQWPDINVSPGLYRIDGNIGTCGGHTACLDMALYYIQQHISEELSQVVAKEMLYSGIRAPDTTQPNAAVSSWKDHRVLKKALKIMEASIERPVSIVEISEQLGVSCRQLEYLSSRHFSETPTQRYTRIRINYARELLLYSNLSITDISCASGYNSVSSFSRCFSRQFECSPTSYRSRFIGDHIRPFVQSTAKYSRKA